MVYAHSDRMMTPSFSRTELEETDDTMSASRVAINDKPPFEKHRDAREGITNQKMIA